jgi:hypothetical protein
MMKSISTRQFGRVMVTMEVRPILRLQKKPKGDWAKTEKIVCQLVTVDGLRTVAQGAAIKGESETDTSLEAVARATKLAFKRALRFVKLEEDRVALWKAWGVK